MSCAPAIPTIIHLLDTTHLYFAEPVSRRCCELEPTTHFVNRDGRTRCPDCDDFYLASRLARALNRARTPGQSHSPLATPHSPLLSEEPGL